MSLQGLTTC